MNKTIGQQTIKFESKPKIISSAAIVGPKEGAGPLGEYFDKVLSDSYYQEQTWEKAERKMAQENIDLLLQKAKLSPDKIDHLIAGDLLDQTVTSNFVARKLPIPYLGIYGACSTMVEGMILGGTLIDGGYARRTVNFTSSHYQGAERQYRTPNEYGDQYPSYKQWTATGSGATLLAKDGSGPVITEATVGKVVDLGVKDPMDLGSAMAPAAADTILQHLNDTGRNPEDYDLIITGDLAEVGSKLLKELLNEEGVDLAKNHDDCGLLLYNSDQRVGAGGSGCACSAVVTASYLLPYLNNNHYDRIFVVATGALLSPITSLQGETIPCIAHGIVIENESKNKDAIGNQEYEYRQTANSSIEESEGDK